MPAPVSSQFPRSPRQRAGRIGGRRIAPLPITPRTPAVPAAVFLAAAILVAGGAAPAYAIPAGEARTKSFKLQSEGMKLHREGHYKEAIALFEQVVNLQLNSFMAWYYLGISMAAERRYGEAVEPLKIALDLQPDYIQAHVALGDAHLKLGETTEARAAYQRAIELQQNYAPAYDGLGRLLES